MCVYLILIPLITYCAIAIIFFQLKSSNGIADAFVKTNLIIFTFIAISTESLSLFKAIRFGTISKIWIIFLLASLIVVAFNPQWIRNALTHIKNIKLTLLSVILICGIALILTITFLTAIIYPPNNYDSMTYHMSRVVHWITNNSVDFYPTANTRQNYQMPLAEYAILHLQIMTGNDFFANLVQWMSFLVLICLAALVSDEFGFNKEQRLISSFIVATIPMAILQASSTQNDLVTSSFVMAFALFMLRLRRKQNILNIMFAATAMGLALLSKGTAYLYCAPIGIIISIPIYLKSKFRTLHWAKTTGVLALVFVIALLFNFGHLWRNYKLYNNPLSTEGKPYQNEDHSTSVLISNLIRNGALHLASPSNKVNLINFKVIHFILGQQLNDPKTTFLNSFFRFYYSVHEDTAGNPVHMIIILFCLAYFPITWLRHSHTQTIWYAFAIFFCAILYCWYLKWQPWASRLHTPMFAMAAPLMALSITVGFHGIRKYIGYLILLILMIYSLPYVLANNSRPIIKCDWAKEDRVKLYFNSHRTIFDDYKTTIDVLKREEARYVGLYIGGDDYEYPFWALSRTPATGKEITFRHVGVNNISKDIHYECNLPLFVIATKKIDSWKERTQYKTIYSSEHVMVLKKVQADS